MKIAIENAIDRGQQIAVRVIGTPSDRLAFALASARPAYDDDVANLRITGDYK